MSSDSNVELARRLFEAFAERDADGLRAVLHPEGELKSVASPIEGEHYSGHESVERYLANVDEVWKDWGTEQERFEAVGSDTVLCVYRVRGFGKESNAPVDVRMAMVWRVRDGLLYRGQTYFDVDEASAAAGV